LTSTTSGGIATLGETEQLRVLNAWREFPDGKSGANTIARLANQVQCGDLMWTRDGLGQFWLCKVTGPWRFDKSPGVGTA
jgi:hypothetical protein